ncbi:MAG: fatty-acid--CoA ligase, partial [Campylobacteraceae bacterium]|nr:fatty-acid--CoA ligase [Campylobacteraceae bacterium]
MGIKKYIGGSIIFLVIFGIVVHLGVIGQASYELTFLGYSLELPVALWLILPATVLFLASVVHLLFYSVKNFLATRANKKDYDTLVLEIKHTLLNEEKSLEYKT